jgi:thiosulfate/3-mercaptopyruvate sulfurtransferase
MVRFYISGLLLLSLMVSLPCTQAGCSCSGGTWDPSAFLNSEPGTDHADTSDSSPNRVGAGSADSTEIPSDRTRSFPNGEILKSMKSVSSSELVIDVSNTNGYAASHIKNAIHVPSRQFIDEDGNLKTVEELAGVLGDAGVSSDDSLVLYGPSESSGEAEFAYLVLRYLGHEDLKLLDGSLADWKAAGLPEETTERLLPKAEYRPAIKADIIADYEYVMSGKAQIVDVRPFEDFGQGRIAGSTALDPSNVIKGEKIKESTDLGTVFSRLEKDKPIVVYSDDYSRSSLVWYALQLMGFQARIYTWEDWRAHQVADVLDDADDNYIGDDARSSASDAGSKYKKLGIT